MGGITIRLKRKKEKRVEGERIEASLEDLKETNIMIRTS
jgi:hypothetical protein